MSSDLFKCHIYVRSGDDLFGLLTLFFVMAPCLLGAIIDIYLLCKNERPKEKPEYYGRWAWLMKWNFVRLLPLCQLIARFILVEASRRNRNETVELPKRLKRQLAHLLKIEKGRHDFDIQEGNETDVEAQFTGDASEEDKVLEGMSAEERKEYLRNEERKRLQFPVIAKLFQAELLEYKFQETFLESAPQLCFQLAILQRTGT